jgi:branched-chain amino acid transport system substrate-binding protein
VQASVLASYAAEKGYKSAYILKSPDSAYTLKLPEYFATAFKAKGGQILGEGTFSMGQQDFSAEVTKITALNPAPEVIMTAAYEPDFPAFIRQLRGAGINTPILGSDGIDSPTTVGLGPLVEGVVFTTAGFASEGSPLAAFNAKYKQKFGQDPDSVYIANGYDLGKVIEAAVTKADSLDPVAIRDATASLENVLGVTGPISYAGTQGIPLRSVALVRIDNGARSLVSQGVPSAADVPAP